jgi:splicing factor 3B subunit 1
MDVAPRTHEEIEAQIREIQARKSNISVEAEENGEGVPLTASAGIYMDGDIYGDTKNPYEGYVTSIAADEADVDDDDYESSSLITNKKPNITAPTAFLHEIGRNDKDHDPFAERRVPRIADREDEYRAMRRKTVYSPDRLDPFADGRVPLFIFYLNTFYSSSIDSSLFLSTKIDANQVFC